MRRETPAFTTARHAPAPAMPPAPAAPHAVPLLAGSGRVPPAPTVGAPPPNPNFARLHGRGHTLSFSCELASQPGDPRHGLRRRHGRGVLARAIPARVALLERLEHLGRVGRVSDRRKAEERALLRRERTDELAKVRVGRCVRVVAEALEDAVGAPEGYPPGVALPLRRREVVGGVVCARLSATPASSRP
eukprot:COSAG06_NODE_3685_length_5014_cov_4.732452_1_plen_190_part_00